MQPVIYLQAGRIALVRYAADGSLTIGPDSLIAGNGTVQMIQPTFNIPTTELADGNSDWPLGVYDTGKSGTLQVTMSSYQPNLFAALIGSDYGAAGADDKVMMAVEEPHSVMDDGGGFGITLAHEVADTIVVVDTSGSPFVSVASGPAEGEYSVADDKLTFNSADEGKEVFVTYNYEPDSVTRLGLKAVGSRPTLHAVISGKVSNEAETQEIDYSLVIDRCKATGDLNPPPQQREPQPWSFTLQVLRPRLGRQAVDIKYAI